MKKVALLLALCSAMPAAAMSPAWNTWSANAQTSMVRVAVDADGVSMKSYVDACWDGASDTLINLTAFNVNGVRTHFGARCSAVAELQWYPYELSDRDHLIKSFRSSSVVTIGAAEFSAEGFPL